MPSGGKRVAATAARACSAVSTMGTRKVCVPMSRKRLKTIGSFTGMRTIGCVAFSIVA